MWHSSSDGKIEINVTMKQALRAAHQGQCDADVMALSKEPAIARQLKKIDPSDLRNELDGYGSWTRKELADHDQNIQRFLWLACGNIVEENPKHAEVVKQSIGK